MQEEIKNGLKTIGMPLVALVLVFALVAMPVAAAGLQVSNGGVDANGQYVTVTNTDALALTIDSVDIGSTTTTVTKDMTVESGQEAKIYLGSGTDDATNGVYYLGLTESEYDRHEEDITVNSGGNSVTSTVIYWADAGADQSVVAGDSVTVSAYDTYSDVTVTDYSWDFTGDGIEDANGANASYTYDTAGTYDVELTITTDRNGVQTDSVTVTVEEANNEPIASAGSDQSVVAGDTVTFDGSNSTDIDGDTLSYSWDFDGDSVEDATGATPTYTYDSAGSYTVNMTVSDGSLSSTDSLTVTVGEANTPPVIDSGLDTETNISATVDESVSFDASNSSDADSDDLTYSWDFDGDDTEDSANASASYTYDTAGTYDVSLTVSDGTDSVTETYSVVVEEASEEPVGGGSADDGISSEAILAVLGTFVFLVTVGVAVRRIT